jgi:AmmeMemoRadiSam system protein B/AmmeMemoRadiSam system protein A
MQGNFRQIRPFLAIFAVVLAFGLFGPGTAGAREPGPIQEPVVAGTWYPGNPSELKALVESALDKAAGSEVDGKIAAVVCPHAGFMYSGGVAAYSYRALRGKKFDTVMVIGVSHRYPFRGVAIYDCAGFRTPLGVMPVDGAMVSDLMKREPRIKNLPEAFQNEHSLEMQLPFLQTVLPKAKLVPLIIGDHDFSTCEWLADAVAGCIRGKRVLMVASSDLSHYHAYDTAVEMDGRLLEKLRAMDPAAFYECLKSGGCEACGRGPILTAMLVAKQLGANSCKILHYENSGDVTGEKNSPRGVVGYAAAAFFKASADRDEAETPREKAGSATGRLSDQERAELREIARKSLEAACRGTEAPPVHAGSPRLKEPGAAFVTLYKKGQLRGCIGHVVARMPLADTVAEMAEAAAIHDPRFRPVRAEELGDIRFEISVLTPLKKINSPEEIEVGKHGLVIARGGSMGLLLPQVATEQGWDKTTFLEHTCLKAGLPRDAWKEKGTEIYVFSAEVF